MTGLDLRGRPIAVLGAGTMGAGIAQLAASAGHDVVMYDPWPAAVERGVARIADGLARLEAKGRMTPDEAARSRELARGSSQLGDVSGAALVIEAAPEELAIKRELFAGVAALVSPEAVLATNTSTLSIAAIMRDVPNPQRCLGLHFFNPAPVMKLVEVVRGPMTGIEAIGAVQALAAHWGKTAIVVADTPGFIVNRVARPFYGEALRIKGEGVADVAAIDRLARDAAFPMGPFELMDLIGIDVNLAAATAVFEGFFNDPRFRPHPIQQSMVDSGRLGRKTGSGYYEYPPA